MKYLLIILFSLITFCAFAQDSTKEQVVELKDTSKELENISTEIADLKAENRVLSREVKIFEVLFVSFGSLISIILIIGTTTSFISWKTDRKSFNELHRLSLVREKEASGRDRSIFVQSSQTLNLVNQTLKLAKDASERASKSLKTKLDNRHNKLEKEARELIDEAKAYKDYKILVEDSTSRSDLETLAQNIASLQTNQETLEDEVQLKPFCSFMRGMYSHLHQHFKPAIESWKSVVDNKEAPDSLKIMTLFWMGYEQNNLMKFDSATDTFADAAALAKGAQEYEMKKMAIESKFFNETTFPPQSLLPEIENLYKEICSEVENEDLRKVKSSICLLLGNICLQIGHQSRENNLEDYKTHYEKAKEYFSSAPIKNKWIRFGLGEVYYRLKNSEEAQEILQKVLGEAQLEYSNRTEPRTKVLGLTTVLICSMWIQKLNENVYPTYNLLLATIGPVDDRLSVYSQVRKRNVSKADFLKDSEKLMKEFKETPKNT